MLLVYTCAQGRRVGLNYGQTFTNTATWSIPAATHGLGHRNLRVQCWDASTPRQRIRGQLTVDGSGNVTVAFLQAQSGLAVLNGAAPSPADATGNRWYSFASSLTWTIPGTSHGVGTDRLLIDVYDASSPRRWFPVASVTVHPTTFDITVSWLSAMAGSVVVCGAADTGAANSGTTLVSNPQTITGASHGRGTANLGVQVYDSAGLEVLPGAVTVDPATFDVTVSFLQSQSGLIVLNGSAKVLSLAATVGTLTLTGTNVGLLYGSQRILVGDPGTLTLAGTAATLRLAHRLPATSQSLLLTGSALATQVSLPASSGTLALSGTAATLREAHRLAATVSALTLTGTNVGLLYGSQRVLAAAPGALVLAGTSVTLRQAHRVIASASTLTITGTPNTLTTVLPVTNRLLTASGTAVLLRRAARLPATGSTVTLTGMPVILQYGAHTTLLADPASLTLSGPSATLRSTHRVAATAGTLGLVAQSSVLRVTLGVAANSLSLTGVAIALRHSPRLLATAGSLTLSGSDAALRYGSTTILLAASRSLGLTGVALTSQVLLPGAVGSLSISSTPAVLRRNSQLLASPGTLLLAGNPGAWQVIVTAEASALTLLGSAGALGITMPGLSGLLQLMGPPVTFDYSAVPPLITIKPGTARLHDADAPSRGLRRAGQGRTPVLV